MGQIIFYIFNYNNISALCQVPKKSGIRGHIHSRALSMADCVYSFYHRLPSVQFYINHIYSNCSDTIGKQIGRVKNSSQN